MISRQRLNDDVDYFRARALEEQVAAGRAASPKARSCHDELATMYRFKAAMLSTPADRWSDSLLAGDTGNSATGDAAEFLDRCGFD